MQGVPLSLGRDFLPEEGITAFYRRLLQQIELALTLAAVGIYAVMSFVVAQQKHEIGLRMALGAGPRQVLLLVVGEGMPLTLAGLVLGLLGTYFAGRAMQSMLFNVAPIDPAAVGVVAALLSVSAVCACYLPARRAARLDPMVALRCG